MSVVRRVEPGFRWQASLLVVAWLATVPVAAAHGGGYQLPGTSDKATGVPTPGSTVSGSRYRTQAVPRDSWEFWWEYNGETLLGLGTNARRSVTGTQGELLARRLAGAPRRARRPDAYRVTADIVPALLDVLERSQNTELIDSALLALARSAEAVSTDGVTDAAVARLEHPDPSVASAAALSLGVLRSPRSVPLLKAVCFGEFSRPVLVRAFAALGLGLLGDEAGGVEAREALLAMARGEGMALASATGETLPVRPIAGEVRVAAVVALGLLDGAPQDVAATLVALVADARTPFSLRPHAAIALGRIGDPAATPVLLGILRDPAASLPLRQSAAAALGRVAALTEGPVVDALIDEALRGRDDPVRHFAIMALGRLGAAAPPVPRSAANGGPTGADAAHGDPALGDPDSFANRLRAAHDRLTAFFTKAIERPSRRESRPWACVAAGLYGRAHRDRRGRLAEALGAAYGRERNASVRGALVVALGLLDARTHAPRIERDLRLSNDEVFKGHAAQTLALLRHAPSVPFLLDLVGSRRITPTLRLRVTSALALLDPAGGVERLVGVLRDVPDRRMQGAAARALGQLGGEAAVQALLEAVADESLSNFVRAYAVVGLGLAAEREVPRWNARLREDHNWHLTAPTIAYAIDIL